MGATESVPQVVDGTIDGHDVHDDNDSFCRVPASTAPKSNRLPLKKCDTSPTRRNYTQQFKGGRSSCATLSTILTSESAPYSPHSNESDDSQYSPLSRDDSSDEDCWGGAVLKTIVSLISPQKKNAISLSKSFDSTNSNATATNVADHGYVENGINTTECQLGLDLSDSSEQSWESPTRIQDFPLPSKCALPTKLFQCPHLQPRPQSQNDPEVLSQDILLPSERALPSIRLHLHHLQPPLIEQQHQDGAEDLYHFLHAASKCEAESDLDAAISNLEEFLNRSQSLTGSSFAREHSKATTLHKLGILQWKSGRYFFSEHVLLDCIHMYQRLLDEDNLAMNEPEVYSQLVLEIAHVLVSIGRVYLSKGEGDTAMRCYNECVQHLSSIPKSRCSLTPITPARIFGQACVGAGRVYLSKGKLKPSLKRYKRALKTQLGPSADSAVASEDISALPVHEANVPLSDVAETLSHLGRLYEQRNDLTRAFECHAKALSIYRTELDPYAVDIGYVSNNIGQLYLHLGRFADAEEAFKTAHQVFSLRLGRNHRNTANALLSIGQLYASQGRQKKALRTYKRVLRAEPAVFGQLLAVTLHSVACSYEATYKLEKALKYYKRTLSVLGTTLYPCHLNRARLLHHMAKIAMQPVDSKGEYLLVNIYSTWLEESAEIYSHNKGKSFNHEILHLEASIEEARNRTRRKAQKLTQY